MSGEITIDSAGFREKMRERILAAYVDLIPAEQFDAMLKAEVKAFFETESMLTVKQTQVTVDNPTYKTDTWSSNRTVDVPALVFGSKMTPFRQLVWSAIHQHLQPLVSQCLADTDTEVGQEIAEWASKSLKPGLDVANKIDFQKLSVAMSSQMFAMTLRQASETSNLNLQNAFLQAGMRMPNLVHPN
jgi:hypothetical protein